MKTSFAAAIALVATVQANNVLEQDFVKYTVKYGKSYGTIAEFKFRLEQWIAKSAELNAYRQRNPESTSTVGFNRFSDWTAHERKNLLGFFKPEGVIDTVTFFANGNVILPTDNLPTEIDWRTLGAVNPVQNQASCGSCWAFSAIAAIEGAHAIKTGELLKLSEQQCVDCDPLSEGCDGGW